MANSSVDDLLEPLLPDREATFSFRPSRSPPSRQHTLDRDAAGSVGGFSDDPNNQGVPEKQLETQRSSYFGSLSGRWKSNRFENIGAVSKEQRTRRSQSKRGLRNPIEKKSFVRRAAHSAANEPAYFLKNLVFGIVLWPKWAWDATRSQKTLTVLSLKAGIAAGLASIICVLNFQPPYDELPSMAIWAVVTIDILAEANIGLSLSKGVNRVAGTFSAGALAVILTQFGPDVPDSILPYYVVFWVTFGGFVFRFMKGIPPLKEQWGYAFTVATMAFHILLIGTYQQPEKVTLPLLRFCVILFGFFLASVVNLAFQPVYAGDALHKLVAKNFDTAADVLSRCVKEYCNATMLDHVPDILRGRSEDDKIHQSYHEVVMSDSDVDKLLGAVTWEPCHGRFFKGYPWHLYDDITDYLRYTLYDVIALDSCLRASIQAPRFLRDIFSQEMNDIADECAKVLRTLADSMENMCKFSAEGILCRAQEAALALQNKLYIHTHLLLGRGAMDSARNASYVESSPRNSETWAVAGSPITDNTGRSSDHPSFEDSSGAVRIPRQNDLDQHENSRGRGVGLHNYSYDSNEIEQILNSSPRQDEFSHSITGQQQNQTSVEIDNDSKRGASEFEQVVGNISLSSKPPLPSAGWKENFMQRRSSLGHNWDGTLERISALSLVKFASLLIEVVAKMESVVSAVDELSQIARFQETINPD